MKFKFATITGSVTLICKHSTIMTYNKNVNDIRLIFILSYD